MTIGEKIAKARKEAGMTQAALAEKLGVSSEAVSKWEQGKYEPGIHLVKDTNNQNSRLRYFQI